MRNDEGMDRSGESPLFSYRRWNQRAPIGFLPKLTPCRRLDGHFARPPSSGGIGGLFGLGQDKEKAAGARKKPLDGTAQDRQVGSALRSVYQKAVDEPVPDDLLDLLGKLA